MRKVILLLCGLILFMSILTVWATKTKPHERITIGNKISMEVTLADTDQERAAGFSNHDPIGYHEGMLFIFPVPVTQQFWMNEMLFDLDFIYIRDDTVVHLVQNVKAPIHNNRRVEYIDSPVLFDSVLEVKSGFIQKYDIEIGDSTTIEN